MAHLHLVSYRSHQGRSSSQRRNQSKEKSVATANSSCFRRTSFCPVAFAGIFHLSPMPIVQKRCLIHLEDLDLRDLPKQDGAATYCSGSSRELELGERERSDPAQMAKAGN